MKKVKVTGKLSLNKETVAKLTDDQMNKVNGGITISCGTVCTVCFTVCASKSVIGCYAC